MTMVQKNLDFLDDLRVKYSHQPTFLQSVEEIAVSLLPLFEDSVNGAFYKKAFVAMTEPERTISFRVPWMDDEGNLQFNRGWRVEFSRCVRSISTRLWVVSKMFYSVFVTSMFSKLEGSTFFLSCLR
jgi:hypothetical protein